MLNGLTHWDTCMKYSKFSCLKLSEITLAQVYPRLIRKRDYFMPWLLANSLLTAYFMHFDRLSFWLDGRCVPACILGGKWSLLKIDSSSRNIGFCILCMCHRTINGHLLIINPAQYTLALFWPVLKNSLVNFSVMYPWLTLSAWLLAFPYTCLALKKCNNLVQSLRSVLLRLLIPNKLRNVRQNEAERDPRYQTYSKTFDFSCTEVYRMRGYDIWKRMIWTKLNKMDEIVKWILKKLNRIWIIYWFCKCWMSLRAKLLTSWSVSKWFMITLISSLTGCPPLVHV